MSNIIIKRDDWIDRGRDMVLEALDNFTREMTNSVQPRGWVDSELPALFKAVDAQLDAIAERINSGTERGSNNVAIKKETHSAAYM